MTGHLGVPLDGYGWHPEAWQDDPTLSASHPGWRR
jgi:hypothetical protein